MFAGHGADGTLLPVQRPAAGVRTAPRPNDGPARHARVAFRLLVEAEPAAVPAKNATLITVITAGAVTVPPWLLSAVSVPLTRSGHFLPPCG
jgi:hypothetical protein